MELAINTEEYTDNYRNIRNTSGDKPQSVDQRVGHKKFALVVIATAQLMVMLDLTIVNIALPAIQRGLGFSTTGLSWVVDAYVLAFGGLLMLGGRSGDIFGRRKMLIIGISLFTAASMAGGFATTQGLLVGARVIQGLGAAIASPTALSLIATTFQEGRERHRAMAVYAGMSGAGGALGLLLGGGLVDIASWRWVLFVNVPIGLFLIVSAKFVLPQGKGALSGKLDYLGAALSSLGLAALVFAIERAPSDGWGSNVTIGTIAVAVVLLTLFFIRERNISYAIVPLKFLYHKNRGAGFTIMALAGASMLSLLYFLTQFLQNVLHYSPIMAGVAYIPIPIVIGSVGLAVSKNVGKVGIKPFLRMGPVFLTAGFLLASVLNSSSGYLDIFYPLVLIGIGMGFLFVPLTLNAVSSVAAKESGLASGLLNTSQQLGGSIGLAVMVTVAATTIKSQTKNILSAATAHKNASLIGITKTDIIQNAQVHAFQNVMHLAMLATILAFLVSFFLVKLKDPKSQITK